MTASAQSQPSALAGGNAGLVNEFARLHPHEMVRTNLGLSKWGYFAWLKAHLALA